VKYLSLSVFKKRLSLLFLVMQLLLQWVKETVKKGSQRYWQALLVQLDKTRAT